MNRNQLTILACCALLGLTLGVAREQLWGWFCGTGTEQQEPLPTPVIPEEGVKSADFSLKLFRAALALQEQGNTCVAPYAMASLLAEMKACASGQTRELLETKEKELGFGNTEGWQALAASPAQFCALFEDSAPEPPAEGIAERYPLRLPFTEDPARALTLLNGMEAAQTGHTAGLMLSGHELSSDTQLVAVLSQSLREQWLRPFHPAPATEQDFYKADGGVVPTTMLVSNDAHLAATAPDGSWQAVALFLRREGRPGNPCCLIAILPGGGNARQFARELTAETLSDIRRALAEAHPRQLSIVLPQLQLNPATRNLQPLLLELGLGKIFSQSASFGGTNLDLAVARYSLDLTGQDAAPAQAEGETIRFNQPFIWLIGDLSSATPPLYLGLEEQRRTAYPTQTP